MDITPVSETKIGKTIAVVYSFKNLIYQFIKKLCIVQYAKKTT